MNPVNPHSNSNDEVVSPSQEAEALVAEIAPNVNEDGVAHAGGTNSSAPISGVDDERASPSRSVVIYDTDCALLLAARPSTCQSPTLVN